MPNHHEFSPDWACPPGATISDLLRRKGMTPTELADQIGVSAVIVRRLIDGQEQISSATANALAGALGASPRFWLSRDQRYREAVERVGQQWLNELPVDDMVKFGWIPPVPEAGAVTSLLAYFNVPSVQAWRNDYRLLEQGTAFRTSLSYESQPAAIAAWLRQGEIEAQALDCQPWNRERFVQSFPRIRELTRLRHPEHFLPKLQRDCAECGVAVVVVRAPEGCRASGAARFLSETLGVIQLSFRYLTDDHFWFTFFHEAGHLVLHGDRGIYLEGVEARIQKDEEEANDFAANALIPGHLQEALRSVRASTFEIIRFASQAGVSPGIVVGQLQHLGKVPRNQLNRLKRRFHWEAAGTVQPRKAT